MNKWRVVQGFDKSGELTGYYVVYGRGNDPRTLLFSSHGCYILRSAAEEDAEEYNNSKPRDLLYRVLRKDTELRKVCDQDCIYAYKLFRLRKDGTLGPLFIGASMRVPVGRWVKAKALRTKGFAYRPGWHCCATPNAPHLSKKGRVWCKVTIRDFREHRRPEAQGGLWYTAQWLRVEQVARHAGLRMAGQMLWHPEPIT